MVTSIEIIPTQGLGNLTFGASMEEAEDIMGKAQEIEELDDDEFCSTIVWHYWEQGISLFFDKNQNSIFTCAEVGNEDALLWGNKVFNMDEKQIIGLFKTRQINHVETEFHEWGEKRLSFDEVLIDFYFQNNKLTSINYGGYPGDNTMKIFPN